MATVCAEDKRPGSVASLERGDIAHNDRVLAWRENGIWELELDPSAELESIHVERCPPDVLHFDIFEVLGAVGVWCPGFSRCRMVHDLSDSQPRHVGYEGLHCWRAPGVLPRTG